MPRTIAHSKKDKRSPKKKQKEFLSYFCDLANVSKAAKKAKIGRRTVYDWIENDSEFEKEYDKANRIALGVLEDEATRRAVEGTNKPVWQAGKRMGTIKEYSDTLMIVLLKARAPEKYKERHQVDGKNLNTNLNINSVELTEEEFKTYRKAMENDI
jgi:hypothetical protein